MQSILIYLRYVTQIQRCETDTLIAKASRT
jgi:hypothetical protein